jgi:hypothetical protein
MLALLHNSQRSRAKSQRFWMFPSIFGDNFQHDMVDPFLFQWIYIVWHWIFMLCLYALTTMNLGNDFAGQWAIYLSILNPPLKCILHSDCWVEIQLLGFWISPLTFLHSMLVMFLLIFSNEYIYVGTQWNILYDNDFWQHYHVFIRQL